MTTLHLQTNLPSRFHGHQHPAAGPPASSSAVPRSHPNEADYAAVTPTAARPHPEKAYTSLFDAFVPAQYAFEHARESYRAAQPAGGAVASAEEEGASMMAAMGRYEGMPAASISAAMQYHHQSAYSSLSSSCSEDSSSGSYSTGGPATPPLEAALSGRASPASSFTSVPGNTIYSHVYTQHHHHQQQQQHAFPVSVQGYPQVNTGSMIVANGQHPSYQLQHQNCSQQDSAVYPYEVSAVYGQLQYGSHAPSYTNDQYAIYTGSNMLSGPTSRMMDPATSQSSPDLAYNVLQSGAQVPNTIGNERVVTTAAHLSAQQLPNYAGNEFSHQSSEYLQQQAYFPRHNHSASQSSISTSSLKSVSPAPSLSGSDESGNTSKSTLLSGIVRSNASSRRGSVSSVVSNSGTPYAGHRKDGDKKFVCSYPGCKRAFSRNFNLSTHYNTHLGIKPFPCTHCPKSFSRRHDCARHIAAVHVNESKKGSIASGYRQENGSISPNTCGCGHTCPAHAQAVPSLSGSTHTNDHEDASSAFAFIKGRHMQEEDDVFSGSASSGYESTTSTQSLDSFIGANFGGLAMGSQSSRSPSIGSLSNPSLDFRLVKLEDGEGE